MNVTVEGNVNERVWRACGTPWCESLTSKASNETAVFMRYGFFFLKNKRIYGGGGGFV